MKKILMALTAIAFFASVFVADGGAQGKHNSRLDRCVRNCDSRYKNCMARKKSNTSRCSDERRKCRNSCAGAGR